MFLLYPMLRSRIVSVHKDIVSRMFNMNLSTIFLEKKSFFLDMFRAISSKTTR